jgi:glycosyltransferase involved in cell wall biosynthesis
MAGFFRQIQYLKSGENRKLSLGNTVVSIVIPTLNSGKTLSDCLDSIVNQSYQDLEILLIDGKSTDNTLGIIQKYAEKYQNITYVSENDLGIYDAMNKGISLAKGTWLYFLGSDDKLYNNDVLSMIFKEKRSEKQKVIYGNVLINGDAGWARNGQLYDGEFTLPKLIERNICHQSMFFHKSVFKKCGIFNIDYSICADWDMNLRLWSAYSFKYVEMVVAVFKGGNRSFQIEDNYTEIEKWLTISNWFNYKILSKEFSSNYKAFLLLSGYYKRKKNYFKSFILKFIFYLQKISFYS